MPPLTRIPDRISNYYYLRDRVVEEPPWIRIEDIPSLTFPRPIVLCNGGFDILHSGHMKVLFAARRRAATVVVALDSDDRISRKGPGRPIQTFPERYTSLRYMPIDYVVEITSDADMRSLMKILSPDLRVQGADYKDVVSKFRGVRKCLVHDSGMRTSEIIRRCRA